MLDSPILLRRTQPAEQSQVFLLGFVKHSRFDSSSQQVVGCANSVNISREVQVELLHGDDLRVSTARSAAFDAEGRTLRWLADARDCLLADVSSESLHSHVIT